MLWRGLAVIATAVLCTGCALTDEPGGALGKLWHLEVGPDYARPPVVTPPDFRSQIGPSEAA